VEGGDNTINAAEAAGGIVITGTAEAGSTVTVNGVAAIVAANGTYTATIPAPAAGTDGPLAVTVTSTDACWQLGHGIRAPSRWIAAPRLRSRAWKAATTRSTRLRPRVAS
jgi:hypothetical protein